MGVEKLVSDFVAQRRKDSIFVSADVLGDFDEDFTAAVFQLYMPRSVRLLSRYTDNEHQVCESTVVSYFLPSLLYRYQIQLTVAKDLTGKWLQNGIRTLISYSYFQALNQGNKCLRVFRHVD
jgi:hypothetical protein